MNDRDIIATALSGGFDTACDSTGNAENIISLTLSLATNEADMLTDSADKTVARLAYSLKGRLEALSWFVIHHMDVAWKSDTAGPALHVIDGGAS